MKRTEQRYYAGLDIGGTKSAACLGKEAPEGFEFISKATLRRTADYLPEQLIQALIEDIRQLLAEAAPGLDPSSRLISAGISCGGPIDPEEGLILSPPNLPGWDEIPITAYVSDGLGVPAKLRNDADAGALAEWLCGAGRGYSNMAFLTFGTGIGAGLILNSQLYQGSRYMAGEIGHIRLEPYGPVGYGKSGSVEGFCSGNGIAQLAVSKLTERLQMNQPLPDWAADFPLEAVSAKIVAEAAAAADPLALDIIRISAAALGRALAMMLDLLDLELVLIGSIYSRNRDLFQPIIDEVLSEEVLGPIYRNCRISPSVLGERIGDYAALAAAAY